MHKNTNFDVVVAGAGPVGLFVACELALRGVSTLVLEKEANHEYDAWKDGPLGMRGLNLPSVELLYRRGLLQEVMPNAKGSTKLEDMKFFGHFAGTFIPGDKVDTSRWKHILPGPSINGGAVRIGHLIKVLTARALSLGATILYSTPITSYTTSPTSAEVHTSETTYTASYLIAADGGRSTIRHLTPAIPFTGSEPTWTGYAAHALVSTPTPLKHGFNPTDNGMYITVPSQFSTTNPISDKGGVYYALDFSSPPPDRTQPLTPSQFEAILRRVSGHPDLVVEALYASGTFTDRTKQLAAYRHAARVFFAGDAAHIHAPLGGQGLNLGLGDAMNLGWKVAAVVTGRAGEGLLATYETERWGVGRDVLDHTRAQTACIMPGAHGRAVRGLIGDLAGTRDGATVLAERFGGYGRRYDLGGECWVVGRSAPDFEFEDGSRVGRWLEQGKWLLVDFTGGEGLTSPAAEEESQVLHVRQRAKEMLGLTALLVRPDGVVAWASEGATDVTELRKVMADYMYFSG